MSEFLNNDQTISDSFDQDYGQPNSVDGNLFKQPLAITEAYTAHHPIDGQVAYIEYQDPLKHVHKIQFKPCNIQMDNLHFVNPHEVDSYVRKDGTIVDGYYRDGDGNTDINRPVHAGGGYVRSNPE